MKRKDSLHVVWILDSELLVGGAVEVLVMGAWKLIEVANRKPRQRAESPTIIAASRDPISHDVFPASSNCSILHQGIGIYQLLDRATT